MTDTVSSAPGSDGFQNLFARFWGFEKLIGSALVKIVYYVGLAGIAVMTLVGMIGGGAMGRFGGFGGGFMGVVVALLLGVAWVVLWRFVCEMSILAFMTYNRLGEIRDRLNAR